MYRCTQCNLTHDEIPAFHADRPTPYWDVPESKRDSDIYLTTDACVIADRFFFVRGIIEIPITDHDATFDWGVWVSLSEPNFFAWQENYETSERDHLGPYFGWLCTRLPIYPETMHLKTMVYLRNNGIRPRIVLESTDHPLSVDQNAGIGIARALEMVHLLSPETPSTQ